MPCSASPSTQDGAGPHVLLSFCQLCEQWSLFPLKSALPGMLQAVVLTPGMGKAT